MHTKGILYTVLSAVLFGITPLITRAVYGYGANSMTVVFYRSLFVIPMLAAIMKGRHISFSISAHDLRNTGIIAIFGSGLTTILLFTSYSILMSGVRQHCIFYIRYLFRCSALLYITKYSAGVSLRHSLLHCWEHFAFSI